MFNVQVQCDSHRIPNGHHTSECVHAFCHHWTRVRIWFPGNHLRVSTCCPRSRHATSLRQRNWFSVAVRPVSTATQYYPPPAPPGLSRNMPHPVCDSVGPCSIRSCLSWQTLLASLPRSHLPRVVTARYVLSGLHGLFAPVKVGPGANGGCIGGACSHMWLNMMLWLSFCTGESTDARPACLSGISSIRRQWL